MFQCSVLHHPGQGVWKHVCIYFLERKKKSMKNRTTEIYVKHMRFLHIISLTMNKYLQSLTQFNHFIHPC